MTNPDVLHQRGKALEDQYFHNVDAELIQQMQRNRERQHELEELSNLSGLTDSELLVQLIDAGIRCVDFAAFLLTPLVFVAWADGNVTPDERQAVIRAALVRGLNNDPDAFRLVQHWLVEKPDRNLWDLWKSYAGQLSSTLPPDTSKKVGRHLWKQAKEVAMASGGTLGFGKISEQEQRYLDEVHSLLSLEDQQ